MDDEEGLSTLTNELFRRVGRNLVNFQKIEGMLKFLVASGSLRGPIDELSDLRSARTAAVHRSMMGTLAGRFGDEILSDAGHVEIEQSGSTEMWLGIQVTFEADAKSATELRDGLRALVDERNDLVHHLQSRWDSRSMDSTRAVLQQLDRQRERLIPVFERLQGMVRTFSEGVKECEDFLASPEGLRAIELWCGKEVRGI